MIVGAAAVPLTKFRPLPLRSAKEVTNAPLKLGVSEASSQYCNPAVTGMAETRSTPPEIVVAPI